MNNSTGTYTLFKRETKRFLKVWSQTLLAPVISNLLFFAVFGLSLHRSIQQIQGVGYMEFLVPGLIMMGVSNNSFQNPSSSIISVGKATASGLLVLKLSSLINIILLS